LTGCCPFQIHIGLIQTCRGMRIGGSACECIGGIGLLLLSRCGKIVEGLSASGFRLCVLCGRLRLFDGRLGKAHADLIAGRVDNHQQIALGCETIAAVAAAQ